MMHEKVVNLHVHLLSGAKKNTKKIQIFRNPYLKKGNLFQIWCVKVWHMMALKYVNLVEIGTLSYKRLKLAT